MLTQIINGRILTPQGWLKDGSVLICDGKILEVTNSDLAVIGATAVSYTHLDVYKRQERRFLVSVGGRYDWGIGYVGNWSFYFPAGIDAEEEVVYEV